MDKKRKLTSVINGQETQMTKSETDKPKTLSEEDKFSIKVQCSALCNLAAEKSVGDLIKLHKEANPPITLTTNQKGIEAALCEKIRRPKGKILAIDYRRVGGINVNNDSVETNLDFLKDFPNLSHLRLETARLKDLNGISKIKSLKKLLIVDARNADLKNLKRLKTLTHLTTNIKILPFLTENKGLKNLWIRFVGGNPRQK